MEFIHIGQQIKSLRTLAGLSQRDLAFNICTQAQISKIENNNEVPSAIILYKIARKLGVDMNYFFEIQEVPRLDYVMEVKEFTRELIRERNYEEVLEIIKNEKTNPLFQTKYNQQFILWHEAICFYYIHNKSEDAIELLRTALSLTHTHNKTFYTESEIEIVNSIAIIQKDLQFYEDAESNFREGLNLLKYVPQQKNKLIRIRLIYGLSKLFTDLGRYKESIQYCKEGIKLCKRLETLYLFGELQYQYGSNLARKGEVQEAEEAFEKASQIFQLQDNELFIKLVEENKNKLLED